MAAIPRADEVPFTDVEGLQHFLAEREGGEPFEYARDNARTLKIAEAHGVGDHARRVIATSREMDDVVAGSVARAKRAELAELAVVEPINSKRTSPPAVRPLARMWLDDVDAAGEQARPYLIKGLLEIGALMLAFGAPKCGKSFSMVDLAGHIAAGLSWRGLRTHAGLVVYLAAEAGASIQRRGRAWRTHYVGEARETRVPLLFITEPVNLLRPVAVEHLVEQLAEIQADAGQPIVLLVLDTLNRCMAGGDENSAADMSTAVDSIARVRDAIGCAVAIVHHSGKDETRGSRGHTSLTAAMDVIARIADKVMHIEGARDLPSGGEFPFGLEVVEMGEDADGDPLTTCVAVPAETGDAPTRVPKSSGLRENQEAALKSLCGLYARARKNLSEGGRDPAGARILLDGWWHDCEKRGMKNNRFHEAKKSLVERALVAVEGPHVRLLGADSK